ncbi:MAG: glutamate-cysteine ligase family protein, partial [Chlamydiota bacterium]|nr:glutamate-cysteine ligase family protein [Chlamydiota bacterium]
VLELKTWDPVSKFDQAVMDFNQSITSIHTLMKDMNACLLPTGMHPFMNPVKDTHFWPHENHLIYETFDHIFNCRRHGWANLQSCQVNLPFCGNDEFVKLHTAIRFLMPIMPALAASSPIADAHFTGFMDYRLAVYQDNASLIPSISGDLIPEPVTSIRAYQSDILERIYRDIAPYDPENILQYEWLNARGAIARFDRDAIEIRVLDMQECPSADIAVCQAKTSTLTALVSGCLIPLKDMLDWSTPSLLDIYQGSVKDAEQTIIVNKAYLEAFGMKDKKCTASELWQHILNHYFSGPIRPSVQKALDIICKEGTLSRRILKALGNDHSLSKIKTVYKKLQHCLTGDHSFLCNTK